MSIALSQPTATAPSGARAPAIVVLLLILVILVPIEISFYAGPLFFTASKLFLMCAAPIVLLHTMQIRLRIFDWLFFGHVIWSCVAFTLTFGPSAIGGPAGNYFLEFMIVYLAARVYLVQQDQIVSTIRILLFMVIVSAAIALPEAILQTRFIHDFASSLTGISYRWSNETRMGIMRAASFFEHPILYGVFCSSLFSLVWFTSSRAGRLWKLPLIGGATFLSASSAPLLVLILQVGLLGIEWLSRGVRNRVAVISGAALAVVLFLNTASNSGVAGLVARLTLNPHTAYTRRSQWNFGIDDVMAHPFFGFDPSLWTRPHWLAGSVDNYWLLMMMRSGIPSIVLLALSVLFIWRALAARGDDVPEAFRKMRTGWGLTMVALILGGATVAYFGKLQPLFAFYMGLGAALAGCALPQDGARPKEAVFAPAYTRFSKAPPAAIRPATAPVLARGIVDLPRLPVPQRANIPQRLTPAATFRRHPPR